MFVRRAALLILVAVSVPLVCVAQQNTASILGTVYDSSGAVIPGATISIKNLGTSVTVELLSDQSGAFAAPALPVGTYSVTVSMPNFKTYVQQGIRLSVADVRRIPVTLETGAVNELVTVTANAFAVDTASSTLGGTVHDQQVKELPLNGRALTQVLATVPGVLLLGPPSMNGGSMSRLFETSTRFLLDGGDSGQIDSDLPDGGYGTAARMTRASVESIEEVRIQTSSFAAEYGSASAGVVNFITKSGTNQFNGSVFHYFRNDVLDAREFFAPRKPAMRLNQFGVSLGGPIVRDKTFFFSSFEGVRQRRGVTQNGFVPTADYRASVNPVLRTILNTLPLPNGPLSPTEPRLGQYTAAVSNRLTENVVTAKVDHQFTSKDRFSVRYNFNDSDTYSYAGLGERQGRIVPYRSQFTKLNYTKTFSPTLLNELGYGVNRLRTDVSSGLDREIEALPITIIGGGSANAGPLLFNLIVGNTSETLLDTVSWVKGRHQIRFGTQVTWNQLNKGINFQNYLLFLGLGNAATQLGSNQPFALLTIGNATQGQRNTVTGLFVQDDFQVSKRLTLNLGLRYDYSTTIHEAAGRNRQFDFARGVLEPAGQNMFDAPKLNFGPRFGFAYNPDAKRNWVIRGGFGLFFIPINPVMGQNSSANDPVFGQSRTVTIFDDPTLTAFPQPPNVQNRPSSGDLWVIDKNFSGAYNQYWNLNVQRSLGRSTVLQAAYIGNRGNHFWFAVNRNLINPATGRRPYAFANINNQETCCATSYNSMQVSLKRRYSNRLAYNVNWTWSHNLDIGGLNFGTAAQNINNLRAEWANSDYDVRHVLQFDFSYQLPDAKFLPPALGNGWQINSLSILRSGLSVNVVCGCDPVGIGVTSGRANLAPGANPRPANYSTPNNQIDIKAFSSPAGTGKYGNVGRNTLKGPSVYNFDFSLFKSFPLKENRLQFRAEFFNIFNTPQFGAPGSSLNSPATFGRSLSTISAAGGFPSSRQIQFALKFLF